MRWEGGDECCETGVEGVVEGLFFGCWGGGWGGGAGVDSEWGEG